MSKYRGFRSFHTQSERRQNQEEWIDDYFIPVRGPRKPHRLPNAWDDIQRNDKGNSWKNYRFTQYKIKSNKPKRDSSKYAASMSKRDHLYTEHRYCSWKGRRCKYCAKHNLWAKQFFKNK